MVVKKEVLRHIGQMISTSKPKLWIGSVCRDPGVLLIITVAQLSFANSWVQYGKTYYRMRGS